jgi:PAS domain S-box/diguanylate cyclase (GGDEF) domain
MESEPTSPSARGDTSARAVEAEHAPRRVNPYLLGYLMGPAALVAILLLGRYHVVAQQSVWVWIGVFIAIPSISALADIAYRRSPTVAHLQARVAVHAAAVTVVIYLSGWGPVLTGAFVFVALENIAHDGSRTWRMTMAWSLVGIAVGQLAIWLGWAPSFLTTAHAEALGLMGVFVLLFVIRMAGASAEKKEDAEASMRASEDRFRSLVQHSTDTTLVIGDDLVITYASPATLALLGREPEAVIGLDATKLVHPDDRERVGLQFAARLQEQSVADPVEFRMSHIDGSWRDAEAVLSDLRGTPSVAGYVANLRDTTERKEAEALLAYQAVHDPLTGLANRTLILDRAEQMLARCVRAHQPIAALFIDLDNFKDINDTLGHEAGDKLLQAVADRFTATVRASDTVGRLGGDEFVILTEGAALAAGPDLLAERLQEVLREPFRLEGFEGTPLSITGSIGIAGGQRGTAEELLRDADIALYRAKAVGKDCWALFEPEMQFEVLDRLGLKMDLQTALERDEFFLLYQPLFDLDTTHVYGVEALIRWDHPRRGVVGPDDFIPMLEESGLIVDVGRWVLDEACRQAAAWKRRGHNLTVSVNVSMRQLETPALVAHVRDALAAAELEPSSLLLEITETALMRDADATIARLTQLKTLGVLIAIDDFGTGYSSFGYLRQFPVDALKIDRSFITAMSESPESGVLIHTMVALGRALGLGTLAEGIEDCTQLEQLRNQGCERGQGFLISRPIDADAIEAMLVSGSFPSDRGVTIGTVRDGSTGGNQ